MVGAVVDLVAGNQEAVVEAVAEEAGEEPRPVEILAIDPEGVTSGKVPFLRSTLDFY